MASRIAAIPMTLSDLQGHLPVASLCDSSAFCNSNNSIVYQM